MDFDTALTRREGVEDISWSKILSLALYLIAHVTEGKLIQGIWADLSTTRLRIIVICWSSKIVSDMFDSYLFHGGLIQKHVSSLLHVELSVYVNKQCFPTKNEAAHICTLNV